MKKLTRNYINSIADRIIKAYMELPENKGNQIFWIDPELLLKKVLGLKIEYARLSLDGSILGLTSFCEVDIEIFDDMNGEYFLCLDGKTIVVDDRLHSDKDKKGRCNFTIMHECAHQVFKMIFPKEYNSDSKAPRLHFYTGSSRQCRKPIQNWEEWQANTLAAPLLLPEDLIRKNMYILGLGGKIECLNKIYRRDVYNRFAVLADMLGSSRQALAIRMKALNLLKLDYLDDPYRMIAVERDEKDE